MIEQTLTTEYINNKFHNIEQRLLTKSFYFGWNQDIEWLDVNFEWIPLPLYKGGTTKRGKIYGRYRYSYRGNELTREEAMKEVKKPLPLRQALIEAETFIECTMCGFVLAGKEALEPYMDTIYTTKGRYRKKPWGHMFYKRNDDKINESIYINICPKCMNDIYNGVYRK